MLENLLEYYRKSDGATKKKVLNTIFAEKFFEVNGKATSPIFSEPIKLMLGFGGPWPIQKKKKR